MIVYALLKYSLFPRYVVVNRKLSRKHNKHLATDIPNRPALHDKRFSIAVLLFENLSNNQDDDFIVSVR